MPFASGGYHGLYHAAESVYGTTPVMPSPSTWTPFRHTSCNIQLKRDQFESKELRADRAITDMRLGTYKCDGDVGIELSYGAFDPILEALMGGTWAVAYAKTSLTVALHSTNKTLIRSTGSWITDGVKVGDILVLGACTTGTNNGNYTISVVDPGGLSLTWSATTASSPFTEAGNGAQTATTTRFKLNQGIIQRSFSLLRRYTDITQYQIFSGCCPNKLSLDFKPGGMVTGSIGWIGSNVIADINSGATYAAASTYSPMDAFSAAILEGGAAFAKASAITLTLENGIEADYVVGSKYAPQCTWGRSKLTGKLTAFFEDLAMYNKFLNETPSSLQITAGDGTRTLVFYMDNVKYTGADNPVSDEKPIHLDMGFAAVHDTVFTNLEINRNPGV